MRLSGSFARRGTVIWLFFAVPDVWTVQQKLDALTDEHPIGQVLARSLVVYL